MSSHHPHRGSIEKPRRRPTRRKNTLEKEITKLRDSNRTLQLKLRDIEVANDDFERQARYTTSSLEDLDSKYSMAVERGVMMEEDIRLGEQEREALRVDVQRLREELADVKIEAEILQDKLTKQEARHLSAISTDLSVPESPTPRPLSQLHRQLAPHHHPARHQAPRARPPRRPPPARPALSARVRRLRPSRPPSAKPGPAPVKTPASSAQAAAPLRKSRLPSADHSVTPKPKPFNASTSSRPPPLASPTSSAAVRTPVPRPQPASPPAPPSHKLPPSTSLSHIRSLTAQMQRLEARVQSARSKLPAPVATPPRPSPRSSPRARRRAPYPRVSPFVLASAPSARPPPPAPAPAPSPPPDDTTPTNQHFNASTSSAKHIPRLSTSAVSRLSFGPLPNRNPRRRQRLRLGVVAAQLTS